MADWRKQYWEDAVGEALSEMGLFHALTDEQRTELAEAMSTSAEMMDECSGRFSIPDPYIAEKRQTEERHKRELEDAEKRAEIWKQEGCRVAKVDPQRAYINAGEVWVSRS